MTTPIALLSASPAVLQTDPGAVIDVVQFENAGAASLAAGVATLGHVFLAGEVPAGGLLTATLNGMAVAVQIDVKTTYDDGSAKMAVLSVARPALAAGATADVALSLGQAAAAPALDLAAGLTGHGFTVDLTAAGGATTHIDVLDALRDALADGTASFWQHGALATQARVDIPLDGSQRLVFDVTVFKDGGLSVEAQFNNDRAMEAVGGRVAYQATVTLDGHQVAQETLDQGQYQNWHASYSTSAGDGGQGLGDPAAGWLNIRQDVAHLEATGAVAAYNLSNGVAETLLDAWGDATHAPGWGDPLADNGVTQYMPGTGGRSDIGFTTASNTAWLMTQDPRVAAYAMGQAETASAVPWNLWDAQNGSWLSTDDYPRLWTDYRGGTGTPGDGSSTGLTQQPDAATGWSLDPAHQPDLSYVPYLLTGGRWMLDNLQAQGAWNLLAQWPAVRQDGDDLLVNQNQVRGAAWALRQVDEAAWASPDGSAEKAYFTQASDANWSWLVAQIPKWTAEQGEAHGWVPGVYGTAGGLPPWQQDYFASTAIAAASKGNADALTFLNWEANFLVGRFTHEAQGLAEHDGAAYILAIGDATTGATYKTWAEIGAQTVARGWSNGTGWAQSQGDYPQLALATLAGIAHLTGSAAAATAYVALVADSPPFTGAADYLHDPTFSLTPPGDSPGTPPVITPPVVTPPDTTPTTPDTPTPPVTETPVTETPVTQTPGTETPADPVTEHPGQPSTEIPATHQELSIVLGAQSWQGDPRAAVSVDGLEVFRGTITTSHHKGGEEIQLGQFAAGAHIVTVAFLNDGWGGTAETDRNLYVEDIRVDGTSTGTHALLTNAGAVEFGVLPITGNPAKDSPAGDNPTGGIPAGDSPAAENPAHGGTDPQPAAGVLQIGLSQDAWQGDARYLLLLDGKVVGDEHIAQAAHAQGAVDHVDLALNALGAGPHALTVRFLNDGWGGTADADRNLYVDSITLNGVDQHQEAALLHTGDYIFNF